MSDDLPQRLRNLSHHDGLGHRRACADAADEIERLRARVAKLEGALREVEAACYGKRVSRAELGMIARVTLRRAHEPPDGGGTGDD